MFGPAGLLNAFAVRQHANVGNRPRRPRVVHHLRTYTISYHTCMDQLTTTDSNLNRPLTCLNVSGAGAVYGYDAVGSFERVRVACAGGGLSIMQPVLDRLDAAAEAESRTGGSTGRAEQPVVAVGLEEALALVRKAFVAGGERDISLGDEVEIVVLTREGRRRERLQLKSH